jgi:7-cyano-7-deazaguanine synthase in queuosine biosynthesis
MGGRRATGDRPAAGLTRFRRCGARSPRSISTCATCIPRTHWAVVGQPPEYDTPDEDVYLEGRNIVLLSKTAILCARLRVNRIALGPLSNNPFPDASLEFFATMARRSSLGLARDFTVDTPLTSRTRTT